MPKDFLALADWPAEELRRMLARAQALKELQHQGKRPRTLEGRTLAMYFEIIACRT
jgi:ornithine carbamoyltransferase